MLFQYPTGGKTFAADECGQADIKNCGSFVSKKPSGYQCNIKQRTPGALLSFYENTAMASKSPHQYHIAKEKYSSLLLQLGKIKHY